MNPLDKERLVRKFQLEFNYNTNHIEGNTLTYGQTEVLLLFGRSSDGVKMKDLEEMKAHNVCLKMIREEAELKDKPLTEVFIRNVHQVMLREDYEVTKQGRDGIPFTYTIHAGVYKTRPNSVITVTGERFDYALPEETPALMTDLFQWYNEEEKRGKLSVIELAALFHYRYIRIHPFEDGNGRMARLLVNYILAKHDYPMLVVKSNDKENYLHALNKCDVAVGMTPSDGAHAKLVDIEPFVEYLSNCLVRALTTCIKAAKGLSIEEEGDFAKKLEVLSRQTFENIEKEKRADTLDNKLDLYNLFHKPFAEKLISALEPVKKFYNTFGVHYFMSLDADAISGNGFFGIGDTTLEKSKLTPHELEITQNARSLMLHIYFQGIKAGYKIKDTSIYIHESIIFEPQYYTFHQTNFPYGNYPTPEFVEKIIEDWKEYIFEKLSSAIGE